MSVSEVLQPEAGGAAAGSLVTWSIDRDGNIEAVGAGWARFAEANQGQGLLPPGILGRRLLDHFDGVEVRTVLVELFRRVRERGGPVTIPFRCDSPSELRELSLTISPRPDGGLDFESRTRAVVTRAVPALLLDPGVERSVRLVTVCAWCKRVEVPGGEEIGAAHARGSWLDLDEALGLLPILDVPVPRVTHGICPPCRVTMLGEEAQVG